MQGSSTTTKNSTPSGAKPPASRVAEFKHKIVLLGDQSVGKTSLVTRFMYDTFDQQYQATIGIDFFSKTMHVDDRAVRLHVWDTAGQERFRSLIPSYIRNSSGTLVVYDICSRASFLGTFKWIDEVRAERGDDVVIILVGNKSDAQDQREVSCDEAQKKAKEYGVVCMEVSARTGTNVKALFRKMAEELPLPEESGVENGEGHGNGTKTGTANGGRPPLTKQRDPFLVAPSRNANGGGNTAGSGCC